MCTVHGLIRPLNDWQLTVSDLHVICNMYCAYHTNIIIVLYILLHYYCIVYIVKTAKTTTNPPKHKCMSWDLHTTFYEHV